MRTYTFHYQREDAQNPYSGVLSFQHFRDEKLYSDIVVRPEACLTETERVECYPVSPDAEENGRSEGYYPDTSAAYIRILWKEFEPTPGLYNYSFIDSILRQAEAHRQTLILRLMPHSTRARDDVPEWLREILPCPARPPMMRVKDSPTDPRFMELFLRAVRALGKRFDADPVLDAVDICLPGAWGEGHKLNLYPAELFSQIMDTYLEAFPTTQLMTQVGRPELIAYAAKRGRAVGWRGDGLGEPKHLHEMYPPRIAKITDQWKSAPVSFESYWWMGEWMRQGWNLDEIIEITLSWHISTFNPKSMPIPYEWQEKVDKWIAKMGYHFVIDRFTCPQNAAPGKTADVGLAVENAGVAPIYKKLPLVLRIGDETTVTDTDITRWLPGKHEEKFSVRVPQKTGEYDIFLGILSPLPLYFATDAPRYETMYRIGRITVQ